ncbi:hypothetical protein [Streptomyces antimycoticus]|uniref:hypothetical protein n=1 Tax=Streptomyces antimycoticus TaxID=68175 RepID=UPI001387527F|nr:hypothetical protein [Streptomyces antimycoticus]
MVDVVGVQPPQPLLNSCLDGGGRKGLVPGVVTGLGGDDDVGAVAVHLRVAGFVDHTGGATLLFGRGGVGKSVFLAHACRSGMAYLGNTRLLVRGGGAFGVPSVMRVRDDTCFGGFVKGNRLPHHLRSDEYRLDPTTASAAFVPMLAPVGICASTTTSRTAPIASKRSLSYSRRSSTSSAGLSPVTDPRATCWHTSRAMSNASPPAGECRPRCGTWRHTAVSS